MTRRLLERDPIDEMNPLNCPVVVGQGVRMFPDNGPASRSTWSNREPSRSASRSRFTGRPAVRQWRR